jgi:hypothetical protein
MQNIFRELEYGVNSAVWCEIYNMVQTQPSISRSGLKAAENQYAREEKITPKVLHLSYCLFETKKKM